MTTVSKNAAPVKTHRSKAKAEATRRGLLYALPDWLMIIMLFFVPIVLLVIMAGSRWSLMGGNRGWNFPENFVKVFENKLLGQSVLFTLEYTVIVTIFLLVLGLGLALIVQESTKWNNMLRTCFLLPSATGLASASLLVSRAWYSSPLPWLCRLSATLRPLRPSRPRACWRCPCSCCPPA